MAPSSKGCRGRITIAVLSAFLLFLVLNIQIAHGQNTLLEYFNVEGTDPDILIIPKITESGISGSNLSISSGSITTGNASESSWERPLDYAQGSSGWDATNKEDAKYFSFHILVAGATSFTLTDLSFEERATGAGPSAITVTINGIDVFNDDVPSGVTRLHTIDLSSGFGSDFTDLTTAEVKIKGWDNESRLTSGNGDFRINGIIVKGYANIGSTSSIPYVNGFSNFVYNDNSDVEPFGTYNEWQFISESNVLEYKGDWGSGVSAGFRGNSNVIGYQHSGATETLTIRLVVRNQLDKTINDLSISYDGRVERADQGRSPDWTVFLNDTEISELFYSTSGGVDKHISHTLNGLTIETGDFIVIEWKSDRGTGSGSSKQIGIGNVVVSLDGQMATSLTGTEGFRMLSSPVETSFADLLSPIYTQGATVGANTQNGDPNVFTWDNTAPGDTRDNWTGLTDLSATISAGTGFLVYVFQDDEFGVNGTFPKTLSVSGQENSAGVMAGANNNANGWALLGNPFASPIDFDQLTKNSLTDVAYIWDVNDASGGDTGNGNVGAGSWKTWNGSAGDITGGIIAPFQGFFVQNSDGSTASVEFTESAKSAGGGFFGKQPNRELVRLELSGQGMRNSAWMVFSDGGSMDQAYGDAHQLQPLSANYALLAAQKTGGLFDISMLPQPGSDFELPLEVDATLPGTYTLRATEVSASIDQPLFLEDRRENVAMELNGQTDYKFTLDDHPQKAVTDPLALLAGGPKMAKSSGDSPRFVITGQTSVSIGGPPELPTELALRQNYPNPFNPTTAITYDIPEQSHVRLVVYDLLGRRVDVLVNDSRTAGSYTVSWDASQFSSGTYIYHLETGRGSITRRMTLIK